MIISDEVSYPLFSCSCGLDEIPCKSEFIQCMEFLLNCMVKISSIAYQNIGKEQRIAYLFHCLFTLENCRKSVKCKIFYSFGSHGGNNQTLLGLVKC